MMFITVYEFYRFKSLMVQLRLQNKSHQNIYVAF